jgi:hypothetical protein
MESLIPRDQGSITGPLVPRDQVTNYLRLIFLSLNEERTPTNFFKTIVHLRHILCTYCTVLVIYKEELSASHPRSPSHLKAIYVKLGVLRGG